MGQTEGGQLFREAGVRGVKSHYEGAPKEGYIAPWSQMQEWEQESAIAVYEQGRQFVVLADGYTSHLSWEQKGRFVCCVGLGKYLSIFLTRKPLMWLIGMIYLSGSKRPMPTFLRQSSELCFKRPHKCKRPSVMNMAEGVSHAT